MRAKECQATGDLQLSGRQVNHHQCQAHLFFQAIHRTGAIHQQIKRQIARRDIHALLEQVRSIERSHFLAEAVASQSFVRLEANLRPGKLQRLG